MIRQLNQYTSIKTVKFSQTHRSAFSETLRKRVNTYFKENNLSRYGNRRMVIKSVVMLMAFLGPLVVINTGAVQSAWMLFGCYILSGAGMAGIGMGIMHDANHGSYSRNKKVNKWMGYTVNLIGANATTWKIQHNVFHHTYTNIDDADEDINAPVFLRFSPHAKRNLLHRFQYLYAWVFYGLSTIAWVTTRDFRQIYRYRKMGFFKKEKEFRRELVKLTGWKAGYYAFALVLPMIMVPLSPWIVMLAFFTMHFLTGVTITLVFQAAHVMPDTQFPKADKEGMIENEWSIHQLATTTNFAPRSRIFSWFIGGLNYQIEHHLMPNICHVHYRKLAPIVKKTAQEFDIPYLSKKSFVAAVWDHFKMLYWLGRMEPVRE